MTQPKRGSEILRAIAAGLGASLAARPGWSVTAAPDSVVLRGPRGAELRLTLSFTARDARYGVWAAQRTTRGAPLSEPRAFTSLGPRDDIDASVARIIAPWVASRLGAYPSGDALGGARRAQGGSQPMRTRVVLRAAAMVQ